jgi:hypothetical protein
VTYRLVTAIGLLCLLISGCGKDEKAKAIHDLLATNHADSARALAIETLTDQANRLSCWQEFAHASLDLCRLADPAEGFKPVHYLIEADLLCGAMYAARKQAPPEAWLTTGKSVNGEVSRQINRLIGSVNGQLRSAAIQRQALSSRPDSTTITSEMLDAQATLQRYRDNAHDVIYLAAVLTRMLNALPEASPGSGAQLSGQLDETLSAWGQDLEITADYQSDVRRQANSAFDKALNRVQTDYQDLGYFLVENVTENGVLP